MSQDILKPLFLELTTDTSAVENLLTSDLSPEFIRERLTGVPFNNAYDFARDVARRMVAEGRDREAIARMEEFDEFITANGDDDATFANLHAAMLQIIAGLRLHCGDYEEAMRDAGKCLNLLAREPKRRDEPFLSVLAAVLYDIARMHSGRGEYRQAEREIEKASKIYERLARTDAGRYGAAHMLAVAAATQTYTSRVKQANMLAHFHTATGAYIEMLDAGVEGAAAKLVDSLEQEGRTLARMGKQREAVQYFTRALKYLTRLEPEMSVRQLALSVDLGEALLAVKGSRDKAVHLLNTLLHKATKLHAEEQHKRIVDILLNTRTGGVDILGFWHKIFPK